MARAATAYRAAASHRSWRDQEADVFRRVNGALRAAKAASPGVKARALADNTRLWTAVGDLLRDPENALPLPLKASIISLSITVNRISTDKNPDIDFLITVNENIAAGLSTQP